jgi:hypothetical protein
MIKGNQKIKKLTHKNDYTKKKIENKKFDIDDKIITKNMTHNLE